MKNPTQKDIDLSELFSQTDKGIVIKVLIQPRAAKTEYAGLYGKAFKFRISAPPVEGLANEAVCEYLAKRLKISKRSVLICSGHAARQKRILVKGVSLEQIKENFLG